MAANVHRPLVLKYMSANPIDLFTGCDGGGKPGEHERAIHRERRRRVRTEVHWPVLLFRNRTAETVESSTRDLSSVGFYCLSRAPFTCGERLSCILKIPTHDPGGKERERPLECSVRVMRVEATAEKEFCGIACQIDDYRFAHTI